MPRGRNGMRRRCGNCTNSQHEDGAFGGGAYNTGMSLLGARAELPLSAHLRTMNLNFAILVAAGCSWTAKPCAEAAAPSRPGARRRLRDAPLAKRRDAARANPGGIGGRCEMADAAV